MLGPLRSLLFRWIPPDRQFRVKVFVEDDPDSSRWVILSCGDEESLASSLALQLSENTAEFRADEARCTTCRGVPVTRLSPLALFVIGVRSVHVRFAVPGIFERWVRPAIAPALLLSGLVVCLALLPIPGRPPAAQPEAVKRPPSEVVRALALLPGCVNEPCFIEDLSASGALDPNLARWIAGRPAVFVPETRSASASLQTSSKPLLGALSLGCRALLFVSTAEGRSDDRARKRLVPARTHVRGVLPGPAVIGSILSTKQGDLPLDPARFLAAIETGGPVAKRSQKQSGAGHISGVWAVCLQRWSEAGTDAPARVLVP